MPRCVDCRNSCVYSVCPASSQRNHVFVGRRGKNVSQCRAHCGQRQGITGQRSANSPHIKVVFGHANSDAVGDLLCHPKGTAGNASPNGLTHGQHVGLEPVCAGPAPGTHREGVGFVNDPDRAVFRSQLSASVEVAGLRKHNADVGQRWFHQNRSNVAGLQRAFEVIHAVVIDHDGGFVQVNGCSDVAGPRHGLAVLVQDGKGLVNGSVVAPIVDHDLVPAGDLARMTDGIAVGIGGRQSELPQWKSEALL
ncbi:unannotated protein [freshwater metagenome]|uniref:Unannotated protein n=1 Tax=freshwater metagenome TaxID=449393 RepID=A0A6J6HLE3_9ZZZZ